jgi:predicted double-glycine peptidase
MAVCVCTLAAAQKPVLPPSALAVPIVEQEEDFSCGPAAIRAILKYFAVWEGEEELLYKVFNTTREHGTLPEHMARGMGRFGLAATVETQMTIDRLRDLLAFGKLVILELQAWRDAERPTIAWKDTWDDGHYVVLIALDEEFAYFMDPSTTGAYTYLPIGELLERWHDYNPIRSQPREHRDWQLGVIISGGARRVPARTPTRRLLRLD